MHFILERIAHLLETLEPRLFRGRRPVGGWRIHKVTSPWDPCPPDDAAGWQEIAPGERWGGGKSWYWWRADLSVKGDEEGDEPCLLIRLSEYTGAPFGISPELGGVEGLVFLNGQPVQAVDRRHGVIWLGSAGEYRIAIRAFGGMNPTPSTFVYADLGFWDHDLMALWWDIFVALESAKTLPDNSPERAALLRILDSAMDRVAWSEPWGTEFDKSVREAGEFLRRELYEAGVPVSNPIPRPVVHALGHAHIDVIWLWPLEVTHAKVADTFSNALRLMERYPEFRFTQSQPQLYKFLQRDHPEIFEQVRARIAEGRWNATGATWVETDTNMPSGESLVRQFLYGMRYFQQELGVRPEVLWLPDVFGYSAALPQIMRQSGIRYFFTSKLSWNAYNRFPYDTFWWEGIDGSKVLTHFATTPPQEREVKRGWFTTYNGLLTPQEVYRTWTFYQQKGLNYHLMTAYGWGDGGGGPTYEMVETGRRLSAGVPGMPLVRFGTAEGFFHALEAGVPPDLPKWVGELYLEYHRGTLTSQARIKRANRKSEIALHQAETLASIAAWFGAGYPRQELREAWEKVLLNQFHDVLPGSSIGEVYEGALRDHDDVLSIAGQVTDRAVAALERLIPVGDDGVSWAVFNTLGWERRGVIELTAPGDWEYVEAIGPDGSLRTQRLENDRLLVECPRLPSYGYATLTVKPGGSPVTGDEELQVTGHLLENGLLRAEFDDKGHLVRLFDKLNGREVLAEGASGNLLQLFHDRPCRWDAWDIESYDLRHPFSVLEADSIRVVERGPLRGTLEMRFSTRNSTLVQRVSLEAGSPLLRFDTVADWHERHVMLKVAFPVAVRSPHATFEVQFGAIERPTHTNTSWDFAKFEVAAQRWADISEAGYGVALLNDCKYGHDVRGNVLRLSLLRSPTRPDPEADQGEHRFSYALYPHAGDWRNGVVRIAYEFNVPPMAYRLSGGGTGELGERFGLAECDAENVVIDTLKMAEDEDALIIRVYEAHGGRGRATLRLAGQIADAVEVNLLEEEIGPAEFEGRELRFEVAPYQIRTFKVKPL